MNNNIYVYIVTEENFEYSKDIYHSIIKTIENLVNKSVNLYIVKNEDIINGYNELLENIDFNINNILNGENELCLIFNMIDYEYILHELNTFHFHKVKILTVLSNDTIEYDSVQDYLNK